MPAETRKCLTCQAEYVREEEDIAAYERFDIPASEQCPVCRWKHLLAFWVFGRFRATKSALSGKQLITVLPESVPFPIYDREEFISDKWDALKYGQDYDPNRPFFEQFQELQAKVPHPHQAASGNTNCDWTDDWWHSKDCYLSRSGIYCERSSYLYRTLNTKDSLDITYCYDLEKSYDCLYCFKGYKLYYSFNSRDCIDSSFLYDCRNCTNCFMCWNLRNKQYHILNKQYSKEEYFEKLKEFDTRSYAGIQKLRQEFDRILQEEAMHRANFNTRTVDSTGNFLTGCKKCHNCYFFEESEDLRHCIRGFKVKDGIDSVSAIENEKTAVGSLDQMGYGNIGVLYGTNCKFSAYLDACENCDYCFGCAGLRKYKYCILNKQFSEEEYKKLTEQIKADMKKRGEWGKFFPMTAAYCGYNLTLAHLMYPDTKEAVLARGGKWDEESEPKYDNAINAEDLPDKIEDVTDDITKKRIICPETKLSYNIASHELAFYREHGIPLPRNHFDWRTMNRFRPMTLMTSPQKDKCINCGKEHEHYYSPELGYKKVACVDCYEKMVS